MTMQDVLSGRVESTVQVGPLDSSLPQGSYQYVAPPVYNSAFMEKAETGTAAWWLRRLLQDLDTRSLILRTWDDYYEGNQPLAFASEKFREAFGGRFRAFTSNFCSLVVDGTRERMEVTNFDFGSKRRNARAWSLWQKAKMDSRSQMAHTEALVKSIAYVLVNPRPLGQAPLITVEDAYDTITFPDPQDSSRQLAGLKRYVDLEGHLVVFLYLPDAVYALRSTQRWSRTQVQEGMTLAPLPGLPFPQRNDLGEVPLIPLVNRPRLNGQGKSEVGPVMSNQDAINKYRADALIAAEFGAFRQRWATGLDIPEDPETGHPIEPFKSAVDRLWVVPPPDPEDPSPTETKFGEFSQTDLGPYQAMIESEVGAMASISRMPYHYLLGQPQAVPPSGESLKSSEAGLISKVRTQLIHFGEGWEQVMRLALIASGDTRARDQEAVTNWRDPETRNDAARTDATVKAFDAGLIDRNEGRVSLGYPEVDEPEEPPTPQTEPAPAQDGQDEPLTPPEG